MADKDDRTTDKAVDDLAEETAALRREIANLKAAIAGRAQDVVEGVEGLYDSAAEQASRAGEALRAQAGVVRDNPGTITSAFVLGGVVGLLVGLALASVEPAPRRWYERH